MITCSTTMEFTEERKEQKCPRCGSIVTLREMRIWYADIDESWYIWVAEPHKAKVCKMPCGMAGTKRRNPSHPRDCTCHASGKVPSG